MPNNTKNYNLGFTLIELVIAISIFAVMLSISYRVFSQLSTSKQLLDEERDLNKVAFSLLSRLNREIQHALDKTLLPPASNQNTPYPTTVFMLSEDKKLSNGNPGDNLTFIAKDAGQFMRGQKQQTGISQITYRAEEDPDQTGVDEKKRKYLFIRDETPYVFPAKKAYKDTLTFPIAYNLQGLQFIFYDGPNKTWRNEWTVNDTNLPQLIKFSIILVSNSGKEYSYKSILPVRP